MGTLPTARFAGMWVWFGAAAGWLAVAMLGGCGDPAALSDAGGDGGADASVPTTDIPWLADGVPPVASPALTPCAEGWTEVPPAVEGGPSTCDPYPAGSARDCPSGEAHFPGEPDCSAVGTPCPSAGAFSGALPADRNVVYVQPGATGDGSGPASPYGAFTDFALGGLPLGTVVALSRGTHAGPIRLARGIALWGACASDTSITTDSPSGAEGVVTLEDAVGELRDLTVADSPRVGLWVTGASAEMTVTGIEVARTENMAVFASDGAGIEAHSLLVHETRANGSGSGGRGINVVSGARVELTRGLVESSRDVGVLAGGSGTTATLTDLAVRNTRGRLRDGAYGFGLTVQRGATAGLTRTLLEASSTVGAFTDEADTTLTGTDVVVRDTTSQASDGNLGRGLDVLGGAAVSLSRSLLERNQEAGALANGGGTVLGLCDVVVHDTESRTSDDSAGLGVSARAGATASLERTVLDRNRGAGLVANGDGTAVALTDVAVRSTRGQASDDSGGRGMSVEAGAAATLSRVVLEANRVAGQVAVGAGARATWSDVLVRDTRADARGFFGRGLNVESGAQAELTRVLFAGNREVGLVAGAAGASAVLSHVVVRDTRPRECAETTCPDFPAGHGVGAYQSAIVSMEHFVVEGAALCGVQIAEGAQVDLLEGAVRSCAVGICLQVEPYDTSRLTTSVRFTDNGTNLQATSLPVPEAVGAVPDVP